MLKKYTNKIKRNKLEKYIDFDFQNRLSEKEGGYCIDLSYDMFLSGIKNTNVRYLYKISYYFFSEYQQYRNRNNNSEKVYFLYAEFIKNIVDNLSDKYKNGYFNEGFFYFNEKLSSTEIEEFNLFVKKLFLGTFLIKLLNGEPIYYKQYNVSDTQNIVIEFNIYDGFKIKGRKIPKNILNNYYTLIKKINIQKKKNFLDKRFGLYSLKYKNKSIFFLFDGLKKIKLTI